MKVVYERGTRRCYDEMDQESKDAVRAALSMVADKKGVETKDGGLMRCLLIVSFGHNVETTYIVLKSEKSGVDIAFFSSGFFWNTITKERITLK